MQISALPVSIPTHPGPTGNVSTDALGFEDVLNGLPTDSARPDSGGSGLAGSPDGVLDKVETLTKDTSDNLSDGPILTADPTLPVGIPAQSVDKMLSASGVLAGAQLAARASRVPEEQATNPVIAPKTGVADPRVQGAAGSTLDVPPQTIDVAEPLGVAPEAKQSGTSRDGSVLTTKLQPSLPATRSAMPQPAQAALQPAEMTDAAFVTSPGTQQQGLADPDPQTPQIFQSNDLLTMTAKPEGAKPAVGVAELVAPMQNRDPLRADHMALSRESPTNETAQSAGQPSLTAAIQMLTRDDVLLLRGPQEVPRHVAGIAQLLRTGYQDDRVQASASLTRSDLAGAVALVTGQPVPVPVLITMAGPTTEAEAFLPPTAPEVASAPDVPQAEATAQKPAVAPFVAPSVGLDLGLDALRSDPSLDLPPLSSQPSSASSFASAPHIPASVTPQTLGQTIVQVLQRGEERQIDLALRPEELGRLRFEMTTSGDKVHIVLFIERPEALDLIRRHADHLLNDLRLAGFSQSSLSFGDWSQREQPTGGEAASTTPVEDPTDAAAMVASARFSPVTAQGRLDIRL